MNVPDDAVCRGYIRNHVGPGISGPKYFTAATSEDKQKRSVSRLRLTMLKSRSWA